MFEHFFQCPYCWEKVSILLDPSVNETSYIEDCEVCCNPLEINVQFTNAELMDIDIHIIEQ